MLRDDVVCHVFEVVDYAFCLAGMVGVVVPEVFRVDNIHNLDMPAVPAHPEIDRIKLFGFHWLVRRRIFFRERNRSELDDNFQVTALTKTTLLTACYLSFHGEYVYWSAMKKMFRVFLAYAMNGNEKPTLLKGEIMADLEPKRSHSGRSSHPSHPNSLRAAG